MQTVSKSMGELVAEAIDKLPLVRRNVAKLRMKSSRYRQHVYAELALKLHEDDDCCAMGLAPLFASGATEEMRFSIDIDKLEQFLALIVKYLPAILDIILPLFLSFVPYLALSIAFGASNAMAQGCHGDQEAYRTVAVQVQSAPVLCEDCEVPPVVGEVMESEMPVVDYMLAAPIVVAHKAVTLPVRAVGVAGRGVMRVGAAGRRVVAAMRPKNVVMRMRARMAARSCR